MTLSLVTPTAKPTHDRATCKECGIVTHGIELWVTPEISKKTGRIKRRGARKAVYCADCYRDGKYNEIGR